MAEAFRDSESHDKKGDGEIRSYPQMYNYEALLHPAVTLLKLRSDRRPAPYSDYIHT